MIAPVIVANNFVLRAMKERISLTPLKLQKLIYFLFKEFLQQTGKDLFGERFETWRYGPVLPSVYYEFNSFGKSTITKFARDSQGTVQIVKEEGKFKEVFDLVWSRYNSFSGEELSMITHDTRGAWKKAFNKKSKYLENADIKNEPTILRIEEVEN